MRNENKFIWDEYLSLGKQLYEEEKYEEALTEFEKAERLYPDDEITYFIYLSRKRIDPKYCVPEIEESTNFKERDVNFETFKSNVFTVFDYIMPKRLVGFNTLGKGCYVTIFFVLLFNIITTLLIYMADKEYFRQYWLAPLSLTVLEFMVLVTITKQKEYYLQNYYRINKQIAEMKIQRYFYWFTDYIYRMFGYVRAEKEKDSIKTKLKLDFKRERLFFLLIFLFIVIWSVFAYIMQGMDRLKPLVSIMQCLQVTIFWTIIAFMLRILIMTAKFVYDFGKQSLKPPITESNNQGFSIFLGGYMKLLGLFFIFWIFFWLYFSVVCVEPHNVDIVGVALAWILVCLWTIRLPINLRFVSKQAFNNSLFKYQVSVLKAYDEFCRNPNTNTKENLKDLHDSEEIIKKMTIKTLKPKHILAILFVNIWVFACGAVYIMLIVFKISIADTVNSLLKMIGVSI